MAGVANPTLPVPAASGTGNPPATVNPRAQELFRNAGTGRYYDRAREAGLSLTAWLEAQDPSSKYQDGLDAFERQLAVAKIRTRSVSGSFGADEMDAWGRDANTRALFPEWAKRQWDNARDLKQTRDLAYSAADFAEGSVGRPYIDNLLIRYTQLQPAVPLSELIATTTTIAGNAYRSTRLTDVTAQKRNTRVAEGAPLPRVKLATSDNTIRFGKFGRAMEMTYEQVRRIRIDVMALHIRLAAIQSEVDEVAAVIDIIVNGDGNASTSATSFNLTTLDTSATAGTLTAKAWLAFKQKFLNPYMLTTILVQDAVELQIRLLNLGSANVNLVQIAQASMLGTLTPINDRLNSGVRVGVTPDAPTLKIVGIDSRFRIERVIEEGSIISEQERWILNQEQLLTFSISEGFGVFDNGLYSANIMDVNA